MRVNLYILYIAIVYACDVYMGCLQNLCLYKLSLSLNLTSVPP